MSSNGYFGGYFGNGYFAGYFGPEGESDPNAMRGTASGVASVTGNRGISEADIPVHAASRLVHGDIAGRLKRGKHLELTESCQFLFPEVIDNGSSNNPAPIGNRSHVSAFLLFQVADAGMGEGRPQLLGKG